MKNSYPVIHGLLQDDINYSELIKSQSEYSDSKNKILDNKMDNKNKIKIKTYKRQKYSC